MKEKEMQKIANWVNQALEKPEDEANLKSVRTEVEKLCKDFPLYG